MYLSSLAECWYTGRSLRVISVSLKSPRLSGYNSPAGPELLTLTMLGRANIAASVDVTIAYLMKKYKPQYIRGNAEITEIQRQCSLLEYLDVSSVSGSHSTWIDGFSGSVSPLDLARLELNADNSINSLRCSVNRVKYEPILRLILYLYSLFLLFFQFQLHQRICCHFHRWILFNKQG